MKLTVKLPNFTLTRGKVPKKSGGGLRGLRRNFRKYMLWGLAGLFFFVLFAWLSLPTRAIAWRISREARAAGYLIDVEDVSVSLFGSATLENVRWTFSPSRPDQVPMTYVIEEVDVDISLLSLIAGNIDVDLEIELNDGDDGTVTANYYRGSDESSVKVEIEGMPLYRVPKAMQMFNAPLRGIVALEAEMTMPEHKFADANGFAELTCSSCSVGDDEETLFIPGSKSLKEGIKKFPEVDLGTLVGHMTIEKGVATIDRPLETDSEDLWVELTGGLDFRDPFGRSRAAMVLKFNLKDKLLARSEELDVAFKFSSEKSYLEPERPGRGYRLEGPISAPRFIPIKAKSRQQSRADRRAKAKQRDADRRRKRSRSRTKPKPTIGEPLDVEPIDAKPSLPGGRPSNEPPPTEPPEEPAAADDSGRGNNGNRGEQGEGDNAEEPAAEEPAADEGGEGDGEAAADEGDGNEPQAEEEDDDEVVIEGEGGEGEAGGEEGDGNEGGEQAVDGGDDGV